MANASNGNAYIPGGGSGGGVAIAAGGATQTSGTVAFANSNGITFGYNNGTITATVTPGAAAGIAAVAAGTQTATSGTQVFSNSNNVSFGMSGSTQITASANPGVSALSAGTTSVAAGAVVLSNSNGLSFGLNGSTITGSYTVPGATVFSNSNNISFGLNGSTVTATANPGVSAVSAGTTSVAAGALVLSNSNGVSFGLNGSTITGSVAAQSVQTEGRYALGNTTGQSSSSTFDARTLSISGAGGVSVGYSGNALVISGGAGGGGSVNFSAGTTSSNLASVILSNSNGISFGLNGATITASASGAGASATALMLGNTTAQSSSNTFALSAFNVSFSGVVSGGMSGNTLVISAPGTTNFANLSVSAGTTSGSLGSIVFSNSNGVSFGLNGSTITASAAGGGVAIAASNSTFTSGTVVLSAAGGALTISNGAQSALFSVPQTSSLSATGAVSISVNGGTISIGVPSPTTNTDFYAPYEDIALAPAQIGNGSLIFDPQPFPNIQFDRVVFPIFNTNSAISSGSHSLSFYFGLYSRNASTLSLMGSTSLSTAVTHSGTLGSYSLYSGVRAFTLGSTTTLTSGNYWMAFGSRTSSAGADGSYSNIALNGGFFTDALLSGTLSYGGYFGSAVNATNQLPLGQGYYTASTTGIPASVAFSQINGTASNAGNMQALVFASSTV